MRTIRTAALAAALVAVAGCAGRYIDRGDAAMASGRAADALVLYQQALDRDDDLIRKPEFAAKLHRAQYLAPYQRGLMLERAKQWSAARDAMRQSLEVEPAFADASTALERIAREAAEDFHAQALAAADAGRLDEATALARKALGFQPYHAGSLAAVASAESPQAGPGGDAYSRARLLQADGKLVEAEEALVSAIAAAPDHLPARSALPAVRAALSRARELHSQGVAALRARKLDDAIALLDKSLAVWPANDAAVRDLAEAQALRVQADAFAAQARDLTVQRQWDDALAAADRALTIYPDHAGATAARQAASQQAADAHAAAGRELLIAGKLADAEAQFALAMKYVPAHEPSRRGLADTDAARGDAAAATQRWGAALLWYLQAADHYPAGEIVAKCSAAKAAVAKRVAFSLSVRTTDKAAASEVLIAEVDRALAGQLARRVPPFVTLLGAGQAADFHAAVEPGALHLDRRTVSSQRREQVYVIRHEVPNPVLGDLAAQLAQARRDLRAAEQREFVLCTRCGGTGRHTCSECGGRRRDREDACRRCNGTGRETCRDCNGSGRRREISEHRMDELRRRVDHLARALRNEPPTVLADFQEVWPYVVERHRATATLSLNVALSAGGGQGAGETFGVSKEASAIDETIDRPNPDIGLPADPLDLPSDQRLRELAVSAVSEDAARRIVRAALSARAAAARSAADAARRAGRGSEAIERDVDAAVLVAPVDPDAAGRAIDALKAAVHQTPLPSGEGGPVPWGGPVRAGHAGDLGSASARPSPVPAARGHSAGPPSPGGRGVTHPFVEPLSGKSLAQGGVDVVS